MYICTCGDGCGGCRPIRLQKETSRVEVDRGVAIHIYYVCMCIYIVLRIFHLLCIYAPAAAAGVEETAVCSACRKRPPVFGVGQGIAIYTYYFCMCICIYIELGMFYSVYVCMHLRRWVWWELPTVPIE